MSDGPFINFPDGTKIDIVDPDNIAPVFADLLTEFREVDGVVYLSMATFVIDGDDSGGRKARVVARLRMSRKRAETIYGLLGNLLAPKKEPPETPPQPTN